MADNLYDPNTSAKITGLPFGTPNDPTRQQLQQAPVQPALPAPMPMPIPTRGLDQAPQSQGQGGFLDFLRGLFDRQNTLDGINKDLRTNAQPSYSPLTEGVRG